MNLPSRIKLCLFIALAYVCVGHYGALFSIDIPFLSDSKKKKSEFPLSEQGFWHARKEKLDKEYALFKEEGKKKLHDLHIRKENISSQFMLAEQEYVSLPADHEMRSYLSKKRVLLNERRLQIESIQEIVSQLDELYQKQITLAQEMFDAAQVKDSALPPVLYITLREAREKEEEHSKVTHDERSTKRNIERYEKQKRLESEHRAEIEQDIVNSKSALSAADRQLAAELLGPEQEDFSHAALEDLLNIKFALLNEQKEHIDFKIRLLDQQINYEKDLQLRQARKVKRLTEELKTIEQQLRVTALDVETAKQDLEQERRRVAEVKKHLNSHVALRKKERDALRTRREASESQQRLYSELSQKDPVREYLIDVRLKMINDQIKALDQELELLDSLKNIEDEKSEKALRYFKHVELRFKIRERDLYSHDIEDQLSEYHKEKKKYIDELEMLEDMRSELSDLGITIQRTKESREKEFNQLSDLRVTLFKNKPKEYEEAKNSFQRARDAIIAQISTNPKLISSNLDLARLKKEHIRQLDSVINLLGQQRRFDIWERSPNAIKWDSFKKSLSEAERFLRNFFWRLPYVMNITPFIESVSKFSTQDFLSLLALLALFGIFFLAFRRLLHYTLSIYDRLTKRTSRWILLLFLHIAKTLTQVMLRYYTLVYTWCFLMCLIWLEPGSFFHPLHTFIKYFDADYRRYLVVTIYMVSIPILLFLFRKFAIAFKERNRSLNYLFFSESYELKFSILLQIVLYATAILLPLRSAFSVYAKGQNSIFPTVIFAAYVLMLQVVMIVFVFFHKDELLRLLSAEDGFWGWVKVQLHRHYYPIFMFVLVLLTLSNPYVGFPNLAYKLLFAMPLTVMIIYSVFFVHYYVRKQSAYWFIQEEDGDVIGRFEHAKTYYGIFIVLTFLFFIFCACVVIGWIWGIDSTVETFHTLLSEKWTVPIGPEKNIGIIQFVIMALFVAGAFLTATLLDKFVLSKIFDVLQMDPGVRNTVSSLLNYFIVYIIIVLGLNYIQLGDLVFYVSSIMAIGIGLGAQPFLGDLIAGFLVLIERPVEIGNFVETSDIRGTVQRISPRSTTIRTYRNHLVVIPNKELITKPIINWGYGRSTVGFELRVQASFKSSPEDVIKVLEEVVQSDSRILRIPSVIYRVDEFAESGIVYLVRAHISARRVRQQWDIAGDLRTKIFHAFNAHGIRIPYPQRVVHYADGSQSSGNDTISIDFDSKDPEDMAS